MIFRYIMIYTREIYPPFVRDYSQEFSIPNLKNINFQYIFGHRNIYNFLKDFNFFDDVVKKSLKKRNKI